MAEEAQVEAIKAEPADVKTEPMEETEAKKFKDIYVEDCQCEFDLVSDFQCDCGWNQKITLKEQKAFQEFRIVSLQID